VTYEFDERIELAAVFGGRAKLRPLWFVWKGTKYFIRDVTYYWTTSSGEAVIHHFSVKDESCNLFEIGYNTRTLVWKLLKLEAEG
jgi:hypothetical protein